MNVYAIAILLAALTLNPPQWRETVSIGFARIHERLLGADIPMVQNAFSGRLSVQGMSLGRTHEERCAGSSDVMLNWTQGKGVPACERAVIVYFDLRGKAGDDCIEQLTHLVVRDHFESFADARGFAGRLVGAIWSKPGEPAPDAESWIVDENGKGFAGIKVYEEQSEKYPSGGAPQRHIEVQIAPGSAGLWCLRVDVRVYRFGVGSD